MPISDSFFFEVSWEVVNKVGGIYTILRSKAKVMKDTMRASCYMLGPYNKTFANTEFELTEPENLVIKQAIQLISSVGIKVYHGRWLIPGYPHVVLFDILSGYPHIEGWRHELGEKANIHIPVFDKEASDVLVFGSLVSWFITEVRNRMETGTFILCHFHEWLSSVGLIFLRNRCIDVALVFTTHATLIGRHLASACENLYADLKKYNVDEEAGKRKIYHNYCIERAAANRAHVFTTVSEITNEEALSFLGRSADMILPNGLNVDKYIDAHELRNLHTVSKRKLHSFVCGHFFGHYHFSLEKTLYLFSAGRYEFSNKGVDILIEALARLNHMLHVHKVDVTVVVFLIFQAPTNSYNIESLKGQALAKQLRDSVKTLQAKIGTRIFDVVTRGQLPSNSDLIKPDEMVQLKRFIVACKNDSLPPICTHNMCDDANDPILCNLRRTNLINSQCDKVKVVFHPEFLSATKPLFPIDYEDLVRGCHLGVFPSYYEPYGYTPAECMVMGIPSITSNLSGFGHYIEKKVKNCEDYGIYILDRRFRSLDSSIDELCRMMFTFCCKNKQERVMQRNRTGRLAEIIDWTKLITNYQKAHKLALARQYPGSKVRFSTSSQDLETLTGLSLNENPAKPTLQRTVSMQEGGFLDFDPEEDD